MASKSSSIYGPIHVQYSYKYIAESPTLDEIRSQHGFISEFNPRLTNRFCKDELDLI